MLSGSRTIPTARFLTIVANQSYAYVDLWKDDRDGHVIYIQPHSPEEKKKKTKKKTYHKLHSIFFNVLIQCMIINCITLSYDLITVMSPLLHSLSGLSSPFFLPPLCPPSLTLSLLFCLILFLKSHTPRSLLCEVCPKQEIQQSKQSQCNK